MGAGLDDVPTPAGPSSEAKDSDLGEGGLW
jgi:hypothetical protein